MYVIYLKYYIYKYNIFIINNTKKRQQRTQTEN